MNIIDNLYLKSKNYFIFHQSHFLFLLIVIGLLSFISKLPYFNIFLPYWTIIVIAWITTSVVLRLKGIVSFIFVLIILFTVPLFLIFKNQFLAESAGNIAYFLFLVGFIQSFWKYLKGIKNRNAKN